MAGVIPVIFAASIMAFPPTVGQLIQAQLGAGLRRPSSTRTAGPTWSASRSSSSCSPTSTRRSRSTPWSRPTTCKKYGGFIPGVRPGRPTAEYLDRILARLTFPGALYLAAVAALPTILINQTSRQLLLRRHLDPDRGRRGARHDEAARGAADDAQLRGLPQVRPRAATWSCSARRGRQGHAGRAAGRGLRPALLSPPANILRDAVKDETELGKKAKEYMDAGDLVPDDADRRRDRGAARHGRGRATASCSTASRARSARPRCSTQRSRRGRRAHRRAPDRGPRRRGGPAALRPAHVRKNGHVYHVEFDPPEARGRLRPGRLAARCSATTTSPRRSSTGSRSTTSRPSR